MRLRIFSVLPAAVMVLMFVAPASEMRADVIYSNFGPSQTYEGNSWWIVGTVSSTSVAAEVDAFSFTPTTTATVTGADLALAGSNGSNGSIATGVAPLTVYIESNSGGAPGTILDTLTQNGTYPSYPATSIPPVNFTCSGTCTTLDAGTTYWIVGEQTNPADATYWLDSFSDAAGWYYDESDSDMGPWTVATAPGNDSAFDVTGTPVTSAVPEPASLVLLGSGLLGVVGMARRRAWRG